MHTRVLSRPIVFLRARFSMCVRCSILISLIETVRCSIVRCSLPHCIFLITDTWWWPCAAETCCILIPTVNWRCHWQILYCLLYIQYHIGVYTSKCKGKYFILRTKMLYISAHSSPQYQFDVSRGPCFVGQRNAVQYYVLIVWSIQRSAGKVLIPRSACKKKVYLRTGHEDPEGGWRYSYTLSLTSALGGVGGQRHGPAILPAGQTRYPL